MKAMHWKVLALVGGITASSHALFGLGAHWTPAPGFEIPSSEGVLAEGGGQSIRILQPTATGLQGFGVKLWLDFIPVVDVEATANVMWGAYDVSLLYPDGGAGHDTIPLNFDLEVPFVEGKPHLANVALDLSVLYPVLKFPPMVSIAKIYVGAGLTYGMTTAVLDQEFGKAALSNVTFSPIPSEEEISEQLIDAIVNEGFKMGMGAHLILGAKVKPPVIPLAVYANLKYYFLGTLPDSFDSSTLMAFELGAGLAF